MVVFGPRTEGLPPGSNTWDPGLNAMLVGALEAWFSV